MATPREVVLQADEQAEFVAQDRTQQQADLTSSLLKENHDNHDIFFNDEGFHNHIVHHLITLYALNAPLSNIQHAYDANKVYQRPLKAFDETVVGSLNDLRSFLHLLGDAKQYANFLEFFTRQSEILGWEKVVNKYIFAREHVAETMLGRLCLPFLHGIIHLGLGVEFRQPAIVCEALAQVACHESWMGDLLHPAEQAANERFVSNTSRKALIDILHEIEVDEDLRAAPRWSDPNKVRDGIMVRAFERMIEYLAQIRILPSTLDEKVAEMTNMVACFAAGSQNPPHEVVYDFYFMHCMNSTIFLKIFMKQSWLSEANKTRLLEWKIRADLAIYASRRTPKLHIDEIHNYKPKKPSDWEDVFVRAHHISDDGHASKLIRALAHGAKICAPYDDREEFTLKRADWLQMAHMAVDSTEVLQKSGERWIRSAGFREAWVDVPQRE